VSTGLIALLDDVAGLAKLAASTLDDAAAQATKAGAKAAGVVVDDAAVTPRYLTGFTASRELPVVARIAAGSLKNKLLYLLPAALVLSLVAPWAITPLLMLGGAYLCYEGAEKVFAALWPHAAHKHEEVIGVAGPDARRVEDQKIAAAVSTDFILSAEIMAISLASVPDLSFWMQALVLAVVGIGITAVVYGAVALIVKADDAGMALVANPRPASSLLGLRGTAAAPGAADRLLRPLTQGFGRGLVIGMPVFLRILATIGTAAMLWVGGGIILHGLEEYVLGALWHWVHDLAEAAAHAMPAIAGAAEWTVTAAASGIFGLLLGAVLIPVVEHAAAPLLKHLRGLLGGRSAESRGA
jgi:uncharacterized protein